MNEQQKKILYVNGYGATSNLDDPNYRRYLGEVRSYMAARPQDSFVVYLCGGHTNRTDLSEAEAMLRWFNAHHAPQNAEFRLIEGTISMRANMMRFREETGEGLPEAFFCEFSRRPTAEFYVRKIFGDKPKVIGIAFDGRSLSIRNMIYQRYFRPLLEELSSRSPAIEAVQLLLERRRIAAARARELGSR